MEKENITPANSPEPDNISRAARNMGIASFFFGVVLLSITTLKLVKIYKNSHNGMHCRESKVAQICGILSLILWVGIIGFAVYAFMRYTK